MKKYLVLTALMVLTLTVMGLAGCSGGSINAANPAGGAPAGGVRLVAADSGQPSGIWVNGTGKVTITPDIAVLSLGVSDQETSVAAAQSKATDAMNKVMAALKQSGVADKDIKTTSYRIQQVTRWDNTRNESVVTGYIVSNMVVAGIRAVDKAGAVIDAVATAGGDATRINGVSFSVDKPEGYYAEARGKAMADAKSRAEQLASLAGVKLGNVLYITESSGYTANDAYALKTLEAAAPISPGETEITMNVQVAYLIAQ